MVHLPGGVNMIFLAVLALIFFGPRKLPELMRSIGQGIAQFKKAMNEATSQLNDVVNLDMTTKADYSVKSDPTPSSDVVPDSASSYDSPTPYYEEPKPEEKKPGDDRRLRPLS